MDLSRAQHGKSEVYDNVKNQWKNVDKYPYATGSNSKLNLRNYFLLDPHQAPPFSRISQFASVFIDKSFFVIGGRNYKNSVGLVPYSVGFNSDTIGRLDSITWKWSLAGKLVTRRYGHNAIFVDSKLVVVGGHGLLSTEVCELQDDIFSCNKQAENYRDYASYPLLFAVSDDFIDC